MVSYNGNYKGLKKVHIWKSSKYKFVYNIKSMKIHLLWNYRKASILIEKKIQIKKTINQF